MRHYPFLSCKQHCSLLNIPGVSEPERSSFKQIACDWIVAIEGTSTNGCKDSSDLVIVQPLAHREAREQRRGEQAAAGGRADEREARQIQPHAAGVRAPGQ